MTSLSNGLTFLPEYQPLTIELVNSKGRPWRDGDRGGHWYRIHGYEPFPEPLPSVTTTLGVIDKSGPLIGWAKRVTLEHVREHLLALDMTNADCWLTPYADDAGPLFSFSPEWLDPILAAAKAESDRQRDAAADTGTSVHELIAKEIDAVLAEGHLEKTEDEMVAMLPAFLWMEALALEPIAAEVATFNPWHGTPGTVDLVARDSDGRLVVADWKTGGLYPNYAYQVAAYAKNLEAMTGETVAAAYAVQLPKPGETIQCWMCKGADNIECALCEGAGTLPYQYKQVLDMEVAWLAALAAQKLWQLTRGKVW